MRFRESKRFWSASYLMANPRNLELRLERLHISHRLCPFLANRRIARKQRLGVNPTPLVLLQYR